MFDAVVLPNWTIPKRKTNTQSRCDARDHQNRKRLRSNRIQMRLLLQFSLAFFCTRCMPMQCVRVCVRVSVFVCEWITRTVVLDVRRTLRSNAMRWCFQAQRGLAKHTNTYRHTTTCTYVTTLIRRYSFVPRASSLLHALSLFLFLSLGIHLYLSLWMYSWRIVSSYGTSCSRMKLSVDVPTSIQTVAKERTSVACVHFLFFHWYFSSTVATQRIFFQPILWFLRECEMLWWKSSFDHATKNNN